MPEPAISLFIVASWSWTFWHWDISHVIWCELQSVISSQIKPPWPPYCRYCFFYRNSTCKMFLKKIGKKLFLPSASKKLFFLYFYSQALLSRRLTFNQFWPIIIFTLRIWAWKIVKTMASLQAFLSFLPRAPKFPLPPLTPATQASYSNVFWSFVNELQQNSDAFSILGILTVNL